MMDEPTAKAPANKKADDAIRAFVANSETGVIAPEIAEAFDLSKTTARETLSRLEDAGRVSTRTAGSTITLYFVTSDAPEVADSQHADAFGDTGFLSDDQIEYLRTGTIEGRPEPHIVDRISEALIEVAWFLPFDGGIDQEEIALIARRLDISLEEMASMTPGFVIECLDALADSLRTDFDLLYLDNRTPQAEELRDIRHELNITQSTVAERLAEKSEITEPTWVTKLSALEAHSTDPGTERREQIRALYREMYEEDHNPYRNRENWEWPGTSESYETETAEAPGFSTSPSESDSKDDLGELWTDADFNVMDGCM